MSDYPMLISNKLHSFRNFYLQIYIIFPTTEIILYQIEKSNAQYYNFYKKDCRIILIF